MPYQVLTDGDVIEIKRMLFDGASNNAVAEQIGIHASTVSRIVNGFMYPGVEWPDGTVGAMPLGARRKARKNKKRLEEGYLTLGSGHPDYYPISDGTDTFIRRIQALMKGEDPDKETMATLAGRQQEPYGDPDEFFQARSRIDSMFDSVSNEFDAELKAAAMDGSGDTVEDKRILTDNLSYDKLDWSALKTGYPNCKWVRLIEGSEDNPNTDIIKDAICIVLKALPKADWETEVSTRLILETTERLRG